mgnify:FL=1
MISKHINDLVGYALKVGLIKDDDRIWAVNRLLEIFKIDDFEECGDFEDRELEDILNSLLNEAEALGLIEADSPAQRDLFDTKLMGALTPPPSDIIAIFNEKYSRSPKEATDWYYDFSQNTDYIRRYRIKKDLKWTADTEYGKLDITINLSKPEKDPKAIAAAGKAKQSGYPKCQLCIENVGYAGRLNHPARQNHRVIPITVDHSAWFMQYSPYVYYNEHCIVFNGEHTPMKIDRSAFNKLLDFVSAFPHYFVGSNADLPIVGGSILSHEHFQGGHYEFAMAKAPIEHEFSVSGYENVKCGIVKWPMSVIRLTGSDRESLVDLADRILSDWRGYTDESAFVFAQTDGVPHNTITPIARMRNGKFELDLVLRNNITTKEHPLGVFHPHAQLHHIKKENIGLIEVMGLAVLPSRLKAEIAELGEYIVSGKDIRSNSVIEKHADWVDGFKKNYGSITSENVEEILQYEIGQVFRQVLEHAGVFKRNDNGKAAFMRFIDTI